MDISTLLGGLDATTLAHLERDLKRDLERVRARRCYLEQRKRERAEVADRIAALPGSSRVDASEARLKRDLAIVRAAWRGRTNKELASRYALSPATISRIIARSLRQDQGTDT